MHHKEKVKAQVRTSSNEPEIIQPGTLVLRVSVDSVFDQVKFIVDSGLAFLLSQVFGQLAEKGAPIVPCRVVGEVLTDLCGCKVEFGLSTRQDSVLVLANLQVHLADDVASVVPAVD